MQNILSNWPRCSFEASFRRQTSSMVCCLRWKSVTENFSWDFRGFSSFGKIIQVSWDQGSQRRFPNDSGELMIQPSSGRWVEDWSAKNWHKSHTNKPFKRSLFSMQTIKCMKAGLGSLHVLPRNWVWNENQIIFPLIILNSILGLSQVPCSLKKFVLGLSTAFHFHFVQLFLSVSLSAGLFVSEQNSHFFSSIWFSLWFSPWCLFTPHWANIMSQKDFRRDTGAFQKDELWSRLYSWS